MKRVLLLVLVLSVWTTHAQTGGVRLTLTTRPSPLGLGQNHFEVTVHDAKGKAVSTADVSIRLLMPADPKTKHPEMKTEGKLNNAGAGKYSGIAMVTMAGDWEITVTASQNGKVIGTKTERRTAYLTRPKTSGK